MMLSMRMDQQGLLTDKFNQALPYAEFLAGADLAHRPPWEQRYGQCELNPQQSELIAGFTRKIHVLCLTGTWCGDCALQGAAMQRIAEANPDMIDLRFLLRDEEHADLIVKTPVNAGFRVPFTWWLAEDFAPVACFGDRSLSRYRSMARKALGEQATVVAPPPEDPVLAVRDEIVEEFERVHLILRLSARLREKHQD
ncbi:MAG: thioredoxin family protein [Planctomycetota bacterium]